MEGSASGRSLEPIGAAAEIAGACLASRARMLSRWISALYEKALDGSGITVAQLGLLVAVGMLGNTSPQKLGSVLSLERSTVSRNLAPLIANGWLEAKTGDAGRVRGVRLTRAGERVLARVLPSWRRAQAEVARELGQAGVAALHRLGDLRRTASPIRAGRKA